MAVYRFDRTSLLCLSILAIHVIARDAQGVPIGCNFHPVRKTMWKTMTCKGVSLDRVLSSLAQPPLGKYLLLLQVFDCPASALVKLNASHFETNILLESLQILDCGIQGIADYALEKLSQLRDIDFYSNRLHLITNATFTGLKNLVHLTLSNNNINTIQKGAFRDLQKLDTLTLTRSDIIRIEDGALSDLTNLRTLNLDQNTRFTPSLHLLSGMKQLDSITLSGTRVPKFKKEEENIFFRDQEDSLTVLRLAGCFLENTHLSMLNNLKQLELLDLSRNQLGFILTSSLPQLAISVLILDSNVILYIEVAALEVYTNSFISMIENPFSCDCNLLEFSRWLRQNNKSVHVGQIDSLKCRGPIPMYGTKVVDYDAHWWQCSEYMPLLALVAVIVLAVLVALIALIVYCNRVNFKHWLLERRAFSKTEEDTTQDVINERSALVPSGPWMNSLPKGLTGAYLIYNMYQADILKWANKHIEEKLYRHPIRVTIQWPAGPDFIPLWKQVKEHGFDVRHFLVIVNDDLLLNHWPEMSEKSGFENLAKIVLVLMGKKKNDLPKDLIRLGCPCLEWPETETYYASLHRQREQFWKRLRLYLKDLSD